MRTTLTLDDDVATEIERLRRERDLTLREAVNDVMRRGLRDLRQTRKKSKPFRTRPIEGARSLLDNLDNVAEVIALIEGELYK